MNSYHNLIYFETIQENSRIWAHKTATPDIRNVKLLNTEWHNSTYYGLRMLNKFKNIQTYHLEQTLLHLCIIFLWKIDDVSKYDSYRMSHTLLIWLYGFIPMGLKWTKLEVIFIKITGRALNLGSNKTDIWLHQFGRTRFDRPFLHQEDVHFYSTRPTLDLNYFHQ